MLQDCAHKILVVDDDDLVLDLIVTRLELAGFQTFYARNGQEGLARLKEVSPAGMVLDITMPRLDGFGVLHRMRATGASKRCKTLVLTARNQPDDVRRAIALGASDFLAKPFEDAQLIQRCRRLVRPRLARPAPAPVEALPASAPPEAAPLLL